MLDYIIIALVGLIALIYVVRTLYKKYKRLSAPQTGSCGHRCDCCPFAKYNNGMPCCSSKPVKKNKTNCCCG